MTTEEMFTELREEQSKTKYAHHITTNQIFLATKILAVISLATATVVGFLAHEAYVDRKQAQVRRQLDKGIYVGEMWGKKKPYHEGNFSDSDLHRRIDGILNEPYFDWDMRYKHPSTACTSPSTLADSGTNRFTELLKERRDGERRDGPLALTLNR